MNKKRLIKRVRDLYAMAQAVDSSPHEAEIALRRCMHLMDKHGICTEDLETSEFKNQVISSGPETELLYVQNLAQWIAALHDCRAVFFLGEAIEIRGHDVDVMVAELTLGYLYAAMHRSEALRIKGNEVQAVAASKLQYRNGFSSAIQRRIEQIMLERHQEQDRNRGTGTSLAVQKMDAVNANCMADVTKKINIEVPFSTTPESLAGMIDGNRVSLDKQIENEQVKQIENSV